MPRDGRLMFDFTIRDLPLNDSPLPPSNHTSAAVSPVSPNVDAPPAWSESPALAAASRPAGPARFARRDQHSIGGRLRPPSGGCMPAVSFKRALLLTMVDVAPVMRRGYDLGLR